MYYYTVKNYSCLDIIAMQKERVRSSYIQSCSGFPMGNNVIADLCNEDHLKQFSKTIADSTLHPWPCVMGGVEL